MKYIKLFEDYQSSYEKEKEMKRKELMQYSINGFKVVDIGAIESVGVGFVLENHDIILIEWYRYPYRISLWKNEEEDYEKYQDAGSEYDFIRCYKNGYDTIFNTKNDAKTFMYLFQKEFSGNDSYSEVKVKLKYIYTPDLKLNNDKKKIKENDLQKYIGREFELKEYGTFGDYNIFIIDSFRLEQKDENITTISFDLKLKNPKNIFYDMSVRIFFFANYDDANRLKKIDIDVRKFEFNNSDIWNYKKITQLQEFIKEIKKYF